MAFRELLGGYDLPTIPSPLDFDAESASIHFPEEPPMRPNSLFRTALSPLLLGVSMFFVLILVRPSLAADDKGAVPAEYAALVPKDAGVVAFISDFDKFRDELGKMIPSFARGGSMPDLPHGLVETSLPIPKETACLIWSESIGPIVSTPRTGIIHIAFRLPGANADTVSVKGKVTGLTFKGDMVVISQDMGFSDVKPVFAVPAKAENPLVDRLPSAVFSMGILGSDLADEASKVAPMLSLGPMMLQQQMSERLQKLDRADRAAVRKAQNKAVGDISDLLKAAMASIEDIEMMTIGFFMDGESMIADIDFAIGGRVADDHGVSPKVLKALPAGMPGYFAFDGPTLRWLANFEFDLIEGMFASTKEEVGRFDEVVSSIEALGKDIDGGYAGGFSGSFEQTQGIFGVKDPARFLKGMDGMMSSMSDLGIGIDYKPVGDMKWTLQMNGGTLMSRLGGSSEDMGIDSGSLNGDYDITLRTDDGMVFLDQVRKGTSPPVGKGDPALRGDLESLSDSKVVAGFTIDVLGMARDMAKSTGTDFPQEMKGKALLSMILHSPDPRTLALRLRLPYQQFIEFRQ